MCNKKSIEKSPGKVVSELMKHGNKKVIRRKLLFGEAMKCQLTQHFKLLSSRRKKREFGELLVGNNIFFKKYNLLCDLRGTISTKVFNSSRILTNNKQIKTRVSKINELVKQDIRDFFEDDEVSMVCPGKVNYKIGYVSFCKLKPFWVVQHKVSERDKCLCKVHANIEFLVSALFKKNIIDNANIKEFARHVCCHIDNVACLQRMCDNCKDLQIPYNLFDTDATVTYFKWQVKSENFTDKNNKTRSVKHTVKDKITVSVMDAVNTFNDDYIKYLYHEGNVIHQFRAIKMLKTKLNPNEVLIHSDFSENYSMKYSTEIQAFHFGGSRKQYTLHTSQIYLKKDKYSSVVPQSMCTLSECLDHGPDAVWAHLQPIFQFIQRTVPQITIHSIEISLCTWNYMEAGHGKGAPDGVGGCLKRTADRVVAQGEDIDCFESFVKVLKENVRKVELILVYEHDIQSMKSNIPPEIPSFKVHKVVFMKEFPNKLVMRKLSCFDCYDCDKFSLGLHIILPTNEEADCLENIPVEVECDKSADALGFHYVCCVEKQNEDNSITVDGLRKLGNSFTELIVKDNDNSVIGTDQSMQVLPNPSVVLKKRKTVFLFPIKVNVKEL
ncbi:1 2C2-dihydroxy-3-keto-5-methylthiopentene dioxygenase, partial [Aphis craccivora]